MSKKRVIQGVESKNEIDFSNNYRDSRTTSQKFSNFMNEEGSFIISLIVLMVLSLEIFLSFFRGESFGATVFLLLLTPWLLKSSKRLYKLPFKMPAISKQLDPHDLNPKNDKPVKARGITFYGNDAVTKEQLWFGSTDTRVHCLIFGTTGAGKTESLLSICINSLIQASGFIYVDGKADNELFLKIFSMARRLGREDDVLIINYMTGTVDTKKKSFGTLSNTMNPFSDGKSDALTELIVSMLPGGGDGMWKGRAAIFMSALMRVLVYLRDQRKILLDINAIRKHFSLDKLEELVNRDDIPLIHKDGLQDYVWNLPGYDKGDPSNPDEVVEQEYGVFEQHGFITMQFTEVFGMLSDDYGHIMKTQLAEVDLKDVVIGRRILIVLLPALEKSSQSLGNLGKIIVSSVKMMMVSGLGSLVEGSRQEVIDSKPTNAQSPYVTVFDEYGYYATEEASVMPAQARGLGFAMIFAGQDYQAFKKGSADSAASIIANCGIKLCMKLEDPTETFDIFAKAAGEANVSVSSGMQINKESAMGGYADNGTINTTTKQRISVRDLKDQAEGEAHILFKDTFIRAKMFYANPQQCNNLRVNKFLKVPMPEYEQIKKLTLGYNRIVRAFKSFNSKSQESMERKDSVISFIDDNNGNDLKTVLTSMNKLEGNVNLQTRALVSLYSHIKEQKQTDYELENDVDAIDELNEIENEFVAPYEKEESKEEVVDFGSDIEIDTDNVSLRENISKSYKEATKNRKIASKEKNGTDKLREILQKEHVKIENGHNKYNPYKEMDINVSEMQKNMESLERTLTDNYSKKGLLDDNSRLDEGYSQMATEKVISDIGNGTSYNNEVKIQKREHNKNLIKGIIDDIILSDVE